MRLWNYENMIYITIEVETKLAMKIVVTYYQRPDKNDKVRRERENSTEHSFGKLETYQ